VHTFIRMTLEIVADTLAAIASDSSRNEQSWDLPLRVDSDTIREPELLAWYRSDKFSARIRILGCIIVALVGDE
jgi:hypothetical protein